MPMAGFPHPAAPGYIAKLIAAGFKVAVCDQMEDPALARGIVKRGVSRVVTPGMVLDDESLDARANNFLVGVSFAREQWGIAALDVLRDNEVRVFGGLAMSSSSTMLACLNPRDQLV